MRFREIIKEEDPKGRATSSTVIRPSTVKVALTTMQKFVNTFNKFLKPHKIPPVKMGHPTGSSAYYKVDPEDKVYGDIDLQIIVPEIPELANKTPSQIQTYWNKLFGEFAQTQNYVHPTSVPGRPIIPVGPDDWIKIDLMPHEVPMAAWGRYRVTPERGVKGLLQGNLFLTLGILLKLNRGELGIQYKEREGKRLPYASTPKNFELKTISKNIETFIRDIFNHEYTAITGKDPKTAKIDPLLKQFPGMNIEEIKVSNIVNGIKGMARSFELNDMFGKGELSEFTNYQDFIDKFVEVYESKAIKAAEAPKRQRDDTPELKAKGDSDRKSILQGLDYVKKMFA